MRAHTVILGAGATMATIPDGDKNGNKSSVMNNLIESLGLQDIIKNISLSTKSKNLEDIYAEMHSRDDCKKEIIELEKRLYNYFKELEIPNNPTIYDFLILSLTRKDAIATFNWDPLLIQAYYRCHRITDNLPRIFCLHGNVAVGYCEEHNKYGMINAYCHECKKTFPPTKLLYPIKNKDYTNDGYIKISWEATQTMIENSYMITIFGYSAPTSDKKAVQLLKEAWGNLSDRQLEEVSVIDIIDEDEMLDKWKDFIVSHHYNYTSSFFESYLGKFPRRSCETVFSTFNFNIPPDSSKGFQPGMSWDELKDYLTNLLIEEKENPQGKMLPLYYS